MESEDISEQAVDLSIPFRPGTKKNVNIYRE
jgi:hypothetical protein